jgi:hypothetical protein
MRLWASRLAVAGIALAATAWAASAHPVSEWEVKHLPRFPRELVDPWIDRGLPDSSGLVDRNRAGWRHVGHQRHALLGMLMAAARGDEVLGDRAWPAVDAAFARQRRDGGFESAAGARRADDAYGTALWLGDLAHVLLVLDQGPLRGWFRDRSLAVRPKVLAGGRWLATHARDLERRDRSTPRLLAYAQAFTLVGELDHDERLLALGKRFQARALKQARSDGRLADSGEPSEHGEALLRLQIVDVYYPSFDAALACGRGATWLARRVGSSLPATRKPPDGFAGAEWAGRDVVLALLYRHELAGDAEALAAARLAAASFRMGAGSPAPR